MSVTTVKMKVTLDVADLDTDSLIELFHATQLELGYRGQWRVSEPRDRFIGSLTRDDLAEWTRSFVAEATDQGVWVHPTTEPIATRLNDAERALAETGRKLQAVKAFRERLGSTHLGLKEAKDEVDAWAANVFARWAEHLAAAFADQSAINASAGIVF